MSAEALRRIEGVRIETKTELVRQETLLTKLKSLNPKQMMQVLPRTAQDTMLTSLLDQLNLTEQALVVRSKDL